MQLVRELERILDKDINKQHFEEWNVLCPRIIKMAKHETNKNLDMAEVNTDIVTGMVEKYTLSVN